MAVLAADVVANAVAPAPAQFVDYKAHNVTLHLCPASFASFFFLLVVHLTSVFAVQRIKLLIED